MITPRNPLGRSSSPDDDPTGVRALLSALPDPGPMPPDLVERITASLAEEERTRSERRGEPEADGERTAYGSPREASVTPLVRLRRKRRWQVLSGVAGAAAAVVLGWFGLNAVYQPLTATSAGSLAGGPVSPAHSSAGGRHSSGGSTAGGGSAQSTPGRESGGRVGPRSGDRARPHAQGLGAGGAGLSAVSVQSSGRDYRAATFATQAAALATAATKPGRTSHVTPRAGAGPAGRIGTTAGLTDCLAGLGVQPSSAHPAVADLARYAGKPAVVLVVTSGAASGGQDRAWAVGRNCSASDPHVLHGPVTVAVR